MKTDKKAKSLKCENHRISIYPDSSVEPIMEKACLITLSHGFLTMEFLVNEHTSYSYRQNSSTKELD